MSSCINWQFAHFIQNKLTFHCNKVQKPAAFPRLSKTSIHLQLNFAMNTRPSITTYNFHFDGMCHGLQMNLIRKILRNGIYLGIIHFIGRNRCHRPSKFIDALSSFTFTWITNAFVSHTQNVYKSWVTPLRNSLFYNPFQKKFQVLGPHGVTGWGECGLKEFVLRSHSDVILLSQH